MKNRLDFYIILKKILVIVIGVAISAAGISLFYALNIGSDPISVLVDGEHNLMNLSYGTITLINNIVLIIFGLIFARKYLNIGTVIVGLLMGLFINISLSLFKILISDSMVFIIKFLLLFPAVFMLGVGIAIIISVDFGVGTMDLLALKLRDITKIKLKWVKIVLDLVFTGAGFLMGGIVGVGTIIGVLLTGPIIGLTIPLFKKIFAKWLKYQPASN